MKFSKRGAGQRKRAMKNSLAEVFVSLLFLPFKVLWWFLTLPFKLIFSKKKAK